MLQPSVAGNPRERNYTCSLGGRNSTLLSLCLLSLAKRNSCYEAVNKNGNGQNLAGGWKSTGSSIGNHLGE